MPVIGIIENMSGFICPHCGKTTDIFKTGGGIRMAKDMGVPFLGSIPLNARIVTGGDEGKPFLIDPSNKDNPVNNFTEIVNNISAEVKKRS
jgi:ATP-binding protein involved in chromosome partitioning